MRELSFFFMLLYIEYLLSMLSFTRVRRGFMCKIQWPLDLCSPDRSCKIRIAWWNARPHFYGDSFFSKWTHNIPPHRIPKQTRCNANLFLSLEVFRSLKFDFRKLSWPKFIIKSIHQLIWSANLPFCPPYNVSDLAKKKKGSSLLEKLVINRQASKLPK